MSLTKIKYDVCVPFVSEHFIDKYSLLNDELLASALTTNYYIEASLVIFQSYDSCKYRHTNVECNLTVCPFSQIIAAGLPLRSMSFPAIGSWPDLQ